MSETYKARAIRELREMADFIEKSSLADDLRYGASDMYIFCNDAAAFGTAVSAIGECEKGDTVGYINATVHFGDTKLQVTATKSVTCQRVKVADKIIPASQEMVIPAMEKRTVEQYEWQCPDSFLALQKLEASE